MSIVERVKGICLKPAAEWGVIEQETTSTADLFKKYAIPLAAITPIAGFIGNSFIGRSVPFVGTFRMPLGMGLTMAVASFVMVLVLVYLLSLVISALAPSFGAEKNPAQALKVAVYSFTPAWVGGIVQILPSLGILALLAGLYGLYLFYLGLQRVMKCPKEKAVGYTAAVAGIAIAMMIVLSLVVGAIAGAGMVGARAFSSRSGGEVQFDKDSPLGKLADLGKAMEAGNKKMAAAQRSGDTNAQTAAAMEQLGTLMGGGKRVDPVAIDQLKPLIPATFAGLGKLSSNAERAGVAAMMVSKASARYGDRGQKSVSLDISDAGGATGLLGLAAWANVQGEREDDNGFERTQRVDGRLVHEKGSKRPGGSDELTVIVADRFVVSARGHGVALAELKTAMASLDLGKLEALKSVGVQN
jgi:hypothetical protein